MPKTTLNSQRLKGDMLPCILLHATACQLREFTLDLLHAKFISSSITIDCSPRPPDPVRNFLTPPVNENTLAWNSHRFMGAMYRHILLPKDCLSMGSNHIGTVRWNVCSSEPCSLVWRNYISTEIWWDLVSKNSFLHVLRHRPTQKYGFLANSAKLPWSGFKHNC